ncbi:MAG: hypothetical protein Kow0025_25500 [Thermodesulfovibrionales bacterium]
MNSPGAGRSAGGRRAAAALGAVAGAFRFLTIFPVGKGGREAGTAGVIKAFPAVGAAQGLLAVAVAWAAGGAFSHGPAAALVLMALAVSNGGFHLDGLSDTVDGLAKRGTLKEKLAAMKDGRAGAAGAGAVAFSILIKYSALDALWQGPHYLPALFLLPVFSKWTMAAAMYSGRGAREEGLGRAFTEATGFPEVLAVFVAALVLSAAASFVTNLPFLFPLLALAGLFVLGALMADFFRRRLGGLTGDTIGASSEAGEIFFLLAALAWQRQFIS